MNNTLIGFREATGKIDYTFTNDYMFRAILQTNELVLRGLISALLHIPLEEISSVHIENQIALGETLKSKDFILDIHVSLNNNTVSRQGHTWSNKDKFCVLLRYFRSAYVQYASFKCLAGHKIYLFSTLKTSTIEIFGICKADDGGGLDVRRLRITPQIPKISWFEACVPLSRDGTLINLEMQVENRHNWTDRSLSYLCRSFDQLYKSQDYETALPAIHIGILNFTLFPDVPEFYASHKLMNIKNHHVFNDKFTLNVLSLKQIHLATEEDKAWQIDVWAKLFAAKTWRDIKMIAKNNEILTSATESLFKLNADDIIREQCRAREEAERHERTVQRDLAAQAKTIAEQAETIKELKANNAILTSNYNELQSDYDELKSIVTALQKQLADKTDL